MALVVLGALALDAGIALLLVHIATPWWAGLSLLAAIVLAIVASAIWAKHSRAERVHGRTQVRR